MICKKCAHENYCDMAQFGGHVPPITACPKFKEKLQTNADRIRAMTDEELANFIVHRDCCPGFFTGTFSDSNRKKYGFDGRSERCEFGGDECIACWLDWLKEEEGEG